MALSIERKNSLVNRIKICLHHKFEHYTPESENMPFHYRLLGKDRMALYSFIQSLNTTFGASIYEPVALELADGRFQVTKVQVKPNNQISSGAQAKIQQIMDGITTGTRNPDSQQEMKEIREVCKKGEISNVSLRKYDVFLQNSSGEIYCMDIKTVKPNIGGFEDYKRMLLTWAAAEMFRDPNIDIHPMIAIPYNPYDPEPYKRWTMRGIFDLEHEILVAAEMWDFIGGQGAYNDLLDCFERAGIELRPEIDQYFRRFR